MKSFYKDTLKVVSLDEVCRMQQVNDGSFASVDLVPELYLDADSSRELSL